LDRKHDDIDAADTRADRRGGTRRQKLHRIRGKRGNRIHAAAKINWFQIDAVFSKQPVLSADRYHARIYRDRTQSDAHFLPLLGIDETGKPP
jgi:hypothetical protein